MGESKSLPMSDSEDMELTHSISSIIPGGRVVDCRERGDVPPFPYRAGPGGATILLCILIWISFQWGFGGL